MYTNKFYKQYKKNVHSQNGEDGIIEELFKRLNITDGYVCEFGACDGIINSNTFNLVKKGFKAVYIEADKNLYNKLVKTAGWLPKIMAINARVDHNNTHQSLDNILKTTPIPKDFDLLSIDIDSYDYQVWESLKDYKPKIVIIEIDSRIKVDNELHIHNPPEYHYTGFKPMLKLGKEKGYKFLLHTGNMFFVRNDLAEKIDITYDNPLENFNSCWGGGI